jgi:2-amino-4-hydroxy-6-hydroxymethyldihydropteridine diphosphokinase
MPLKTVCLSLGSNLGDREENLSRAVERLEEAGIHVRARSSVYETEPQDVQNQPWFLNLVVQCETEMFPLQLLAVLQRTERELGRQRGAGAVRGGPRKLDIDILLFGDVVMETPKLAIPHPRMLNRRFVLEPLLEIAPEIRHPATKEPISRYMKNVLGQKVKKIG